MIALALILQTQASAPARAPTVGDTVWITRTVPIAPGQTVRPGAWQPPEPVEAVGPPQVTVRGTTAELAYPIAVWRAGEHRLEIPGPLVLGPGRKVDSLPPYATTIVIRSVLPAVAPESIAPQPRAGFVPRPIASWWPLVLLWALAIVLLLPLHWWWRRRGKPVPVVRPNPGPLDPPVDRWADAGERRAVATLAAERLRAALGEARDLGRSDRAADELLATLDRLRFGTEVEADPLALFRRATEMAERAARSAP